MYCCVGDCNKRHKRDTSDTRHFIRWYRFPKNKKRCDQWTKRILRQPKDVNTESMYVCSEHFTDDDFKCSQFLQSRLLPDSIIKIPLFLTQTG